MKKEEEKIWKIPIICKGQAPVLMEVGVGLGVGFHMGSGDLPSLFQVLFVRKLRGSKNELLHSFCLN